MAQLQPFAEDKAVLVGSFEYCAANVRSRTPRTASRAARMSRSLPPRNVMRNNSRMQQLGKSIRQQFLHICCTGDTCSRRDHGGEDQISEVMGPFYCLRLYSCDLETQTRNSEIVAPSWLGTRSPVKTSDTSGVLDGARSIFKSGCAHLRAELSRSGHQCARLGKHHAWKQVLLVLAHRCAQHCGWEEKCWEMGMLHNLRPLVPSSPRSGQGKTGKYGKVWKNTESAKHSPKTCETLKDTGFFDFAHLFG